MDQPDLPSARPMLDCFLALDCELNCIVPLEPNQFPQSVSLRKSRNQSLPMFISAPGKIAGNAGV
jgi:hypothetical protein